MTDHPGDNANNRFRAFWAGLLGFVSFGIVLLLALKAFGPGKGGDSGSEYPLAAVDQQIVEVRKSNLAEVKAAQIAAVPGEALKSSVEKTATVLASKKAAKTELVVPNSPTFIKQMLDAQQAQPAASAPGADPKEVPEETPKN